MSNFDMPNDAGSLLTIKNAVEGAAILMAEEEAIKGQRKDYADEMNEKFEMPKSLFNKMVKVCYKANFEEERSAMDTFAETYEKVMLGVVE